MIVVDTSALFAALSPKAHEHPHVVATLLQTEPPLLLSPFVLAELDYLVEKRRGKDEQLKLLDEVSRGAYRLEPFGADDVAKAGEIIDTYKDLDVSLADASVVVIADRNGTVDLLTLDERHFRVMTPARGKAFRLLPRDTV